MMVRSLVLHPTPLRDRGRCLQQWAPMMARSLVLHPAPLRDRGRRLQQWAQLMARSQVLHPALPRGVAQACAKGLFLVLLLALPARAAYVGATRLDEGAGEKGQIAAFSFSSISKATQSLANSLSAVGAEDSAGTAAGILSWLAMLPSLECADLSRPAAVFLVAPPEGQDLPDQVAVIPLSPINGEGRLRESLAAAYASVSGKTVLHCSRPRDEFAAPVLSLVVTRETAYVASSRESLRWIARHWRDGTIPSVPGVRDGATITAFLDAPLAADVLDKLLAGTDDAGDTATAVRILASFRDLLRGLDAFHASLSADIHAWRLALRLTPPPPKVAEATLPDTPSSPLLSSAFCPPAPASPPSSAPARAPGAPPSLSGTPLSAIPRDAICVADCLPASLAALLPPTLAARFGGESAYSFFIGARPLPGLASMGAEDALAPFLSGESASGFVVVKGEAPARVQAFALSDPAGAAGALKSLLPWGSDNGVASFRLPRDDGGRTIYTYAAHRQASDETAEDYAASALIMLARLNCVEFAIEGSNLVVVSGQYGTLARLLDLPPASRRSRTVGELALSLPPPPDSETVLGAGALSPSQAFSSIIAALPGLGEISRQLPRHGGGVDWRVSRDGDTTVVEAEIANSELLAFSVLRNIDQRQIGGILLDHIIGRQEMAQ